MKRGNLMKFFSLFIILILTTSFPVKANEPGDNQSGDNNGEEINSSDIEAKINSIITYAERYEAGVIDYLQLIIHANSIREEINEMLGEDAFEIIVENESRGLGLTEEAVRNIFGDPTYYEEWVWVENLEQDMKIDKAVPRWEKNVFDGNKIHMSFNAWPHVLKEGDELIFFYRVDFDIKFKKNYDIDIDNIISDVKGDAENYYNTGEGEDKLIEKMMFHQNILIGYLDQNREDCINIMDELLGSENKKKKENRIVWRLDFYHDENYNLICEVHMCDECEWPWVNIDFRIEGNMPIEKEFMDTGSDKEYYRGLEIVELNNMLEKDIEEISRISSDMENNLERFFVLKSEIDKISQILDEKYYNNLNEDEKKEIFKERLNFLDGVLNKYGNIEKSPFDETRYEIAIFKDVIERQDSWCMYIEDEQCGLEEGCYNGECIYALGGVEDCGNGIDDDNDNIIDCNDPDCARDCGRLCEGVCTGEEGCWSNTDELCKDTCKSSGCWDCKENCDSVCGECWKCTNSDDLKEVCHDCWICQDDSYGHGCREECESCNECRENLEDGEEGCESECESCNECESEWNNKNCKEKCGEDELCLNACKGEIIECEEGFFDCDFNGECESKEPCKSDMEICDDKTDNNNDGFIDCEDIGACQDKRCDEGKSCSDGMCTEIYVEEIGEELEEGEEGTGIEEDVLEEEHEEGEESGCERVENCGENSICSNARCRYIDVIIEEYEEDVGREVSGSIEETVEEVTEEVPGREPEEIESEAEPEPERESSPEPSPEVTSESVLDIMLGRVIGWVTQEGCESDEDCGKGRSCDTFRNKCYCEYGLFDCNGGGEGNDKDGCESEDPTCGGKRELCPGGCREHQYCNEKVGWCECEKGFRDCDGDWMNGCEITEEECKGCKTDEDCAEPRCSEQGNVIQKFGCMKGESWIEEKGQFGLGGGCVVNPTGRIDPYIDFYAWGEKFDRLEQRRRIEQMSMHKGWCEWELENVKKERKEIEDSLNEEFYQWFFEEYVNIDPENFERYIGGIWDIYWRIVDVDRKTAEMLNCLDIETWPEEYKEINIKYEGDYGNVEIWEERKEVDFNMGSKEFRDKREMFSPYMKAWIFPNKEFVKNMFIEKMKTGEFLGPPDEHRSSLSPSDLEKIRQDEEVMGIINELIEKYKDAELFFVIKDNEEILFKMLINVNENVLINAQVNKDPVDEPDVYFEADFDFIYNMIEKQEKSINGDKVENPPWEKKEGIGNTIKEITNNAEMATVIFGGIVSGDVKIKPLTGLKYMRLMDYILK
ncbi:MAG: hypothetical protein V1663_02605 [archaeon]